MQQGFEGVDSCVIFLKFCFKIKNTQKLQRVRKHVKDKIELFKIFG